jgi:acyl-CoA thioester hydrolase
MDVPRRRRGSYFSHDPQAPQPLVVRVRREIHFSDVDAMGILWHGRYAQLFEVANEAIGRLCGMTYSDFYAHQLKAPIVQLHVDYFSPVPLAHEVSILGRMIWNEGARMNIEYEVNLQDGTLAAAGYTVQMFMDAQDQPLLASPALYDAARLRWRQGLLSEGS